MLDHLNGSPNVYLRRAHVVGMEQRILAYRRLHSIPLQVAFGWCITSVPVYEHSYPKLYSNQTRRTVVWNGGEY